MKITKTCTACRTELPLENFRKQSGTKDGLQYECKDCTSDRAARRYAQNPEILEKNKEWQENNKDKHNEAAKRYYHSPTGRLNRGLNKALDKILGRNRESLFHLLGTSVAALTVHLNDTLPQNTQLDDYQDKWYVGFLKEPNFKALKTEQDVREAFNWSNLVAKEKSQITEDFGVTSCDDN